MNASKINLAIISLALGTLIGTVFHPGFQEIAVVTAAALIATNMLRSKTVPQASS